MLVWFTCSQFGSRDLGGCLQGGRVPLIKHFLFSACLCRTYIHTGCCNLRQCGSFFPEEVEPKLKVTVQCRRLWVRASQAFSINIVSRWFFLEVTIKAILCLDSFCPWIIDVVLLNRQVLVMWQVSTLPVQML